MANRCEFDRLVREISDHAANSPFVPYNLVERAFDLAETPEMQAAVDEARLPKRSQSSARESLDRLRQLMQQNRLE